MPGLLAHPFSFLLHPFLTLPALAQLDLLQPPPTLPSLPDPPRVAHALLENPIPAVLLAVALGLGAYAVCARLDRRRLGLLGAAAGLGLGVIVLAVAALVETGRERVRTATRGLVAAVATADSDALDGMLADDARMYLKGAPGGWRKDQIIDWVERYLGPGSAYAIESHRVDEVQAEVKPNGQFARTRATVLVIPEQNAPTRCICMLSWQLVGERWVVVEIEPLWVQGWGEVSEGAMRERW